MSLVLVIVLVAVVVVVAVVGLVMTIGLVSSRRGERGEALEPPISRRAGTATIDRPAPVADAATAPAEPLEAVDALTPPEVVEPLGVEAPAPATFRTRLAKARSAFADALGSIRSGSAITADTWDDLEDALIRADVGVRPTAALLDAVRITVKERGITTPDELIDAVKAEMVRGLIAPIDLRESAEAPTIWLFVGVNGVGKTTTIGKLGNRLAAEGRHVVMAAGDTFRAAAAEQLGTWAERCGATLIRGSEGGDPSAVIFDAVSHAAANGADVVLADTAGRLHTKSNLMDELAKVRRVADKGAGSVTEVLLVLDATTGQNGLVQAREFTEATEVTGVVLTKLDGSAKGGIVFAIQSELGIPVKLVGLGESAEDLIPFDAEQFVDALFAEQ